MGPETIDLCSFCLGLVEFRAAPLPLQMPHHSHFGVLLSSSKTCRLCQTIASLWVFEEDDLTRFSSDVNPSNNTREAWSLSVTVTGARLMPSGVHWTFVQVIFESNNTPLNVMSDFTIVSCRDEGETCTIHFKKDELNG